MVKVKNSRKIYYLSLHFRGSLASNRQRSRAAMARSNQRPIIVISNLSLKPLSRIWLLLRLFLPSFLFVSFVFSLIMAGNSNSSEVRDNEHQEFAPDTATMNTILDEGSERKKHPHSDSTSLDDHNRPSVDEQPRPHFHGNSHDRYFGDYRHNFSDSLPEFNLRLRKGIIAVLLRFSLQPETSPMARLTPPHGGALIAPLSSRMDKQDGRSMVNHSGNLTRLYNGLRKCNNASSTLNNVHQL